MERDEIVEKSLRVLLCHNYHLTIEQRLLNSLGKGTVNPEVCEFGNTEEHQKFYRVG